MMVSWSHRVVVARRSATPIAPMLTLVEGGDRSISAAWTRLLERSRADGGDRAQRAASTSAIIASCATRSPGFTDSSSRVSENFENFDFSCTG